jgi:hypothetical protein
MPLFFNNVKGCPHDNKMNYQQVIFFSSLTAIGLNSIISEPSVTVYTFKTQTSEQELQEA